MYSSRVASNIDTSVTRRSLNGLTTAFNTISFSVTSESMSMQNVMFN